MKQTCPRCSRPYDDEWVVYCPVSREMADLLRAPGGLTTNYPVTVRLATDDTIVVIEHSEQESDTP